MCPPLVVEFPQVVKYVFPLRIPSPYLRTPHEFMHHAVKEIVSLTGYRFPSLLPTENLRPLSGPNFLFRGIN